MTTIIFGGGSSFGGGVQSNSPGSPPIQATAGSVTTVTGTINQSIASFNPFLSVQYGISPYTYSVSSGTLPTGITIDSNSGQVYGVPTATQSSSSVTFRVTDSLGVICSTTATVSFTVGSAITATANSVAPVTGYTNQAISTVTPFASVSNGSMPYYYFISSGVLPDRVTLNPTTGQISGTPTQVYTTSSVTISVRDAGGIVASTTSTISFTIILSLVAVPSGTSTVFGYQNSAITSFGVFSSVSGGTAPYTYYISSGTLPTGINFNTSTGLLSGTPTATQSSSNVTFNVKDSTNLVASTTVTIGFIVNTAVTASAGATSSVSVTQNTAITSFNPFSSVSGGYTPYTYYVSSGTLPSGITLDANTGTVSGTPPIIQSLSNVVFSVKDANNLTASTTVTVGFTVTAPSYTINYLVVGGGGAGGGNAGGYASNGGGGAGQMVPGSVTVSIGSSYTITVGAGGTGVTCMPGIPGQGASGNVSSIFLGATPVISAVGGGGGGSNKTVPSLSSTGGAPGGSGGGGSGAGPGQSQAFAGSAVPGSGGSQGGPGGFYSPVTFGVAGGGGGGGAGGPGTTGNSNAPPTTPTNSGGGPGGNGAVWPYTGLTYAGGGGGGAGQGSPVSPSHGPGGTGGTGGGGSANRFPVVPTAGTNGLGGGGAGYGACGSPASGSPGGGGTVILVVPNAAYPGVSAPGATVTTPPNAPGATVLTYTTPVSTTPATFTYTA